MCAMCPLLLPAPPQKGLLRKGEQVVLPGFILHERLPILPNWFTPLAPCAVGHGALNETLSGDGSTHNF